MINIFQNILLSSGARFSSTLRSPNDVANM